MNYLEPCHYSTRLIAKLESLDIEKALDFDLINKAIHWAKKYHDGQFRQSGEAYYTHPLEVMHDIAIIMVVIITVCFRPTLSPIYPNNNAPTGFKAKVEQNAKADKSELVKGSYLGKNISFNTTAI